MVLQTDCIMGNIPLQVSLQEIHRSTWLRGNAWEMASGNFEKHTSNVATFWNYIIIIMKSLYLVSTRFCWIAYNSAWVILSKYLTARKEGESNQIILMLYLLWCMTLMLLCNCKPSNSVELMFFFVSLKGICIVMFPSCVYFHIPSNSKYF